MYNNDYFNFSQSKKTSNRLNEIYQSVLNQIEIFSGKKTKLIMAPREFTEITGNIESSIILSQLLYWQDKTNDPEGWIYKTYKDWYEETGLKESQVKKARITLKNLGVVETKIKKSHGITKLHYHLNYEVLMEVICSYYKDSNKQKNPFC